MSEPWDHRVTHYPLHTTHAIGVPADRAGRVMASIHNRWHLVQFFDFRFVIMWPKRERAEGGQVLPWRPR